MQENIVKASALVIAGFFCMAVFGIFTKAAYIHDSAIWVSFMTYVVSTLVLLPFVFFKGIGFLKSEHFPYHFCRAVFGCAASFLYMLSMSSIPMVNATLLNNAAPIYLPLIAIIFLKATISPKVWLAVAIGFAGLILIVKPNVQIFQQSGDLIGLASGISLAFAYFMIKLLSSTDPSLRIIFYYFFLSVIFQLPLLFFAGEFPPLKVAVFAAFAGVSLVLAQLFLVEGYRYAPMSKVGVFQYTSIVFVGFLDWIIWGVVPTLSDLFGVLLVVLASYMIIKSNANNGVKTQN